MRILNLYSAKQKEGFNLYAIIVDGECFIEDFIDGLDSKNKTQFAALLNQVLHTGPPKNEMRFKNLGDDIYELKTRNGIRVLCFFGGAFHRACLILTHGTYKTTNKIIAREKDRAIQWRQDYIKNADKITIIQPGEDYDRK